MTGPRMPDGGGYVSPAPSGATTGVAPQAGVFDIFNLDQLGDFIYVTEYGSTPTVATRENTSYTRLPDGGYVPSTTQRVGYQNPPIRVPYESVYDGSIPKAFDINDPRTPGAPQYREVPGGTSYRYEDGGPATDPFARPGEGTQGHEQVSIKDALDNLRAMSVNDKEAYQATLWRLWAAGFYGDTAWEDIEKGAWTQEAGNAFVNAAVMTFDLQASGVQISFDDYMDSLIRSRDTDGDGQPDGPAVDPVTTINQFTDPEVLRSTVQSAAQAALGRDLTDAEAQKFLDSFKGMETKYNTQANTAAQDTTGGTFDITTPNAGAQADHFIDQDFEDEESGYRLGGYGEVLRNMVGA